MERTYKDCVNRPEGMVKGCAYCDGKHICIDAFTGISDKCGAFNFELMTTVKKPEQEVEK